MTREAISATRRYERISLAKDMFVAWYGGGEQRVSRAKTLGAGGMFLSEPDALPVGTNLRLTFEVPGGCVHAEGIVRNSAPGDGMGLEFIKMGSRDRVLLERLLRRLYPM